MITVERTKEAINQTIKPIQNKIERITKVSTTYCFRKVRGVIALWVAIEKNPILLSYFICAPKN